MTGGLKQPFRTLSVLLAIGASGCDADCDDPSRLSNGYAVYSNFTTDRWELTGFDQEDEDERLALLDALFVNGWSEWDLDYLPGQQAFDIFLDGQPYVATYSQDENTCNTFQLSFAGTFTSRENSVHDFKWNGDLSYFGTHLGGTFSYTDSWQTADRSGTMTVKDAEMRANERRGQDTGFSTTAWE